jgi:hypothetical protein
VRRGCAATLFVSAVLLAGAIDAADFRVGRTEGLFNLTVAYGVSIRTEDTDDDLVAFASGGNASSSNFDDGNLNYDTGVVSNMVRTSGEIVLRRGNFGAFVRGYAFYDYENDEGDRARTDLSGEARDVVGKDADLLDSYLTWRFHLGGMPMRIRVGDQVINWGETLFVRDGVDVINPVDFVAGLQPATTSEDLFVPLGMVWAAASVTEDIAVEGFYQYEWKATRLPPVGTYFSTNDAFGTEGLNAIFLGAGQVSDQGTDLDERYGLPAGTLGFDQDFNRLPGLRRVNASDDGQYGLTLRTIVPGVTATKIGFHYVRYHTRLPILSGQTGDAAAVAATSNAAVDARAAELAPIYEAEGLSPDEALAEATSTAEGLTLSGYVNDAGYFIEYPEDIDMLGVTFNTATRRRGILLSGELSHHRDFPFLIDSDAVVNAVLSPVLYNPSIGDGPLGSYGADEQVRGFERLDKSQAALGVARIFRGRLGATQTIVSADGAAVYVHDMPDWKDLPLAGTKRPDDASWGYRLLGQLNYNSLFGGLNLRPRVVFSHDVHGSTPGPFGTFLENRKSFTVGFSADYIRRWTLDMRYTNFMGGGSGNRLGDRDVLSMRISYYL